MLPILRFSGGGGRTIGLRSLGSLIKRQGIGDMYRVQQEAQKYGMNANFAYIHTFEVDPISPREAFDPIFMRRLFDQGYKGLMQPDFWKTQVP